MGYRATKSKIKTESNKTKSFNNPGASYTEFYYYTFRNILFVSIPLIIISALILSLPRSSANSSGSDNLAITISSSCTLSSVVNIPHSTEVFNGNYVGNIGKTTITTLCNDSNGYSVYANGYSNNEEGNNKLINSSYPQYSIDTGLATSGLTSAWAMKLNNIPNDPSPTPPTIESDYNNTYGIVPAYWTKVASRASGTTDMAQGSSFTTTYAVYASSSQYAGTYQGQVKYLLTHPAYPPAFRNMQDIANWKNELAMEESVQAIDLRDGKSYWITKLRDGNIWMTQNLDFDIDTDAILNSETTDLNVIYNSSTGQYTEYNDGYTTKNGIIYWKPAESATTIDFQNTNVFGWQNSNTEPYSANKTDSTETGHASLGNYYNWTAAVASNNSLNLAGAAAKNSICPKGWRLPTLDSYPDDFSKLNNLYNNVSETPLFFNKPGYISYTSLMEFNTIGTYLYDASYTNSAIWGVSLRNNKFLADWWNSNYGGRKGGYSVRCVAK